MKNLFEEQYGCTIFTKEGQKRAVEIQTFIISKVNEMRKEETDEKDMKDMLEMFLNENTMTKLSKKLNL